VHDATALVAAISLPNKALHKLDLPTPELPTTPILGV